MSTPLFPYYPGPLRLIGTWKGRRLDAQWKVTGQLQFGDDFNVPNQAFMAIKHSQAPAGTITSMDTSAALAIPGVLAIITPTDVKNNPAWKAIAIPDTGFSLLPWDQLRCGGEEIAAVAAEDPFIAEEACQAIKVVYSPSSFVLAPEDAAKAGAPQVYAGVANAGTPTTTSYGDADTALKASGVKVFTNRYETQNLQHNNVLSHAFTVSYDSTGRVQMWTSTQGVKQMAQDLAKALGIPDSRIRVTNYSTDGAFGDKGGPLMAYRPHILGALLSQMTGRPIHHRYTHEDNLVLGFHSPKQIYYVTTAVNPASGAITAVECTNYNNAGAFGDAYGGPSAGAFYGPYKLPNFKITTNDVKTNTGKSGPYRSPGGKAAFFAAFTHYDMIAASLGMNPVDFMNAQVMYKQGDTDQLTGNRIPSVELPGVLNNALALSGFAGKWKAPPTPGPSLTGVRHGIGIVTSAPGSGAGATTTSAMVSLQPDGSLNIHVLPNSLGQGNREEKILIAAEMMGLPFNMVTLDNFDSDAGIDCGSTVGSMSTKGPGSGIGAACIDARNQMLTKAAATLSGGDTTKLTYAYDGSMRIYLTSDPTKYVTFASLSGEPRIIGVGHFVAPSKTSGKSFNTTVVEVDVDCDTGLVTLTNMMCSQGQGQVIFAAGWEGQGQGSAVQGFGYAIQEEQWPDVNTGLPYVISHLDHKMPLANQSPPIQISSLGIVEQPPDSYNFGAKGGGETFISAFTACVCNAVSNAIGWWPDSMPVTPDKILKGLGKA
jgi:CO/xanthine dehydrogenase Mo-binding subunit